jgi:hypothetical protein
MAQDHLSQVRTEVLAAWPTPMAGTPSTPEYNAAGSTDYERKIDVLMGTRESLNAPKASWPTPMVNDELGSDYCYGPKKADGTRATFHKLPGAAKLANWHTPVVRDHRNSAGDGTNPRDLPRQVSGVLPTGSTAATVKRGQLNPAHSRWLMGYPPVWDACAATAMRSSPKSRKSSSKAILKPEV